MYLTKIKDFLLQNKKTIFFLVFLFFIFFPELGFGNQPADNWWNGGDNNWENQNMLIEIINLFIAIGWVLIWLMTQFVWLFLTPGWTDGSAVWFNWDLKKLWILVSNVVYTIFAIILIIIAFMNIIWKWENTWELKQALPKFIVWVLIVPFSWFIVAAFVGISSILTVSVLSIPMEHFSTKLDKANWDKIYISKEYTFNLTNTWSNNAIETDDNTKINLKEFIEEGNNIFSIMTLYTYWVMSVDDRWKMFGWDEIKTFGDLSVKIIFDLIFFVIFFLLLIALLLSLFLRWILIWVFTVLSPIFGLLYFFWDKATEGLKKFSFSNFVWLVMMPVYVAAALSFGLLFISVAWNNITDDSNCEPAKQLCVTNTKDNTVSTIEFLWIKLNFKWSFGSSWNEIKSFIWGLKWSFGQLILQIFWLVILWMSVMAALRTSELTKEVISPIESFWNSIWNLAMKAPTYAPIIPAPGGAMSLKWLEKVWGMPQAALESRSGRKVWTYQDGINNFFWTKTFSAQDKAKLGQLYTNWVNNNNLRHIQNILQRNISELWLSNRDMKLELERYFSEISKKSNNNEFRDKEIKDFINADWSLTKLWYAAMHMDDMNELSSQFSEIDVTSYNSSNRLPWWSRWSTNQPTTPNPTRASSGLPDINIESNIRINENWAVENTSLWTVVQQIINQLDPNEFNSSTMTEDEFRRDLKSSINGKITDPTSLDEVVSRVITWIQEQEVSPSSKTTRTFKVEESSNPSDSSAPTSTDGVPDASWSNP